MFSSPGFEIVKHASFIEVREVAHILAALELGRVHLVWEYSVNEYCRKFVTSRTEGWTLQLKQICVQFFLIHLPC